MSPTLPPGSSGDDEVLSFLTRLEKSLLRIIEGIVVFFVHRIPKWTFEVIRGCLENLWHYLGWFIRIILRLGRVMVLTAILIALVVGPGVALYYTNAPAPALVVWVGLIVCAMLFALQRRVWKEYERRKQDKAARSAAR